jgi:hypothetical protein
MYPCVCFLLVSDASNVFIFFLFSAHSMCWCGSTPVVGSLRIPLRAVTEIHGRPRGHISDGHELMSESGPSSQNGFNVINVINE